MDYRREIDGLRALAVLPVILFHAGFETFSGGFVGVDVFFVISGYLITTIILAELELGKFSIANFYERRARRILPALFFVMLACIPFAWFWLLPGDMKDFSQSLVAVSVFASNILFWRESGYFDTVTELKPLLHTWSLALEEQYYLLFPLFLMLLWRLGKRWILVMLGLVFVASLAAAHWGLSAEPTAAFYLLPTRGWELLIGAFAAFYLSQGDRKDFGKGLSEFGGWLGVALVLYAVFAFSKTTPFPGFYALVPTIGTVLVILFATKETSVGRFVGNRAFVGIGLVSYSAYLWHQPLFAFARQRSLSEPSGSVFLVLSVLAIALAYLSWRYIEAPFRNKLVIKKASVFRFAGVGTVLFASLGLLGHRADGFKGRLPDSAKFSGDFMPTVSNGWCFYAIDANSSLEYGADGLKCAVGDKESQRKGILFGDSYAGHYEPLWNVAGMDAGVSVSAVTTNWCYPSLNDEYTGPRSSRALDQCLFNRRFLVDSISGFDFVVLSASWGSVLSKDLFEGVLEAIEYLSSNVRVVVLMAAPKSFDANPLNEYKRSVWRNYEFDIGKIGTSRDSAAARANSILREYSSQFGNVIFVERESLFAINGVASDTTSEGIPFSLDGGHISTYGSLEAAANFLRSNAYAEFKALVR